MAGRIRQLESYLQCGLQNVMIETASVSSGPAGHGATAPRATALVVGRSRSFFAALAEGSHGLGHGHSAFLGAPNRLQFSALGLNNPEHRDSIN